MCGILFTDKEINNLAYIIEFLKNRGPDGTSLKRLYGFTFIHTLLSMTGEVTPQPFIDGQIVAMFNGEIYNYKDFETEDSKFDSDGQCIIPLYKEHGESFISKLDGEYALILCDFVKGIMIVSTDIFSTKPLWLAIDETTDTLGEVKREIGVASYRSCLDRLKYRNIIQVSANTTIFIDLEKKSIINQVPVIQFDLKQHKESYDDLFQAIEEAIKKRVKYAKHGIFIGLSSGYDSGSISCILNEIGTDYTAYSILGIDDIDLINQRHMLLGSKGEKIDLEHEKFLQQREFLIDNCDRYILTIDNGENGRFENLFDELRSVNPRDKRKVIPQIDRMFNVTNERLTGQLLTNDNGAIGVSYICKIARERNSLIYLSGSGADEIFSDYGFNGVKFYGHSTIGGKFPEKLETVFPWKNFFDNTQRAYLMKEEYVTGAYGIEGRYPFLDKQVVQEFLWLKPQLKNSDYKAPLHHLMFKFAYPFKPNEKVGFNCGFQGPENNYVKREKGATNKDVTAVVRPDLIVDFSKVKGGRRHGIVYLPKDKIKHYKGYCYSCSVNVNNDLGTTGGFKSGYKLSENVQELNTGNSPLEFIIGIGRGRYNLESNSTIYFSATDNTDPRNNGKYYRLKL